MELGRGAAGVSGSAALMLSHLPHYPQEGEVLGRPQGSGPISSRSGGVCQGGSILSQVSLVGLCSELGS